MEQIDDKQITRVIHCWWKWNELTTEEKFIDFVWQIRVSDDAMFPLTKQTQIPAFQLQAVVQNNSTEVTARTVTTMKLIVAF